MNIIEELTEEPLARGISIVNVRRLTAPSGSMRLEFDIRQSPTLDEIAPLVLTYLANKLYGTVNKKNGKVKIGFPSQGLPAYVAELLPDLQVTIDASGRR